jgi:SAM-dependent methyltransferase
MDIAVSTDDYHWKTQPCPGCGNKPARFLGKRGGKYHRTSLGVATDIWQCSTCALIYPNPVPIPIRGPSQHYGVDAGEYFSNHDEHGKQHAAVELLEQARAIVDQTVAMRGQPASLLDIGCGRGELLSTALSRGWRGVGIDASPTFAEYATQVSGSKVYNLSLGDCRFEPARFDVAVLSGVLEHLYNPVETIAEVARILKPGGALFLDVPNETGLYCRLGNMYYRLRGMDSCVNLSPTFSPYHVIGFNERSLKQLLLRYGFSIHVWRCYSRQSCVPASGGFRSRFEKFAADAVTKLSNHGNLGSFIETWAVKGDPAPNLRT